MDARMMMGSSVPREAQALFARMSTPPTPTRKRQISKLIQKLKGAGVWAKLDVFYVFAAETSQAALLNWKSTSYNATNSSASFTADRGYTRAGTAHIATGYQMGDGQSSAASFSAGVSIRAITSGGAEPAMGAAQTSTSSAFIGGGAASSIVMAGAVADSAISVGLSAVAHLSIVKAGSVMTGYRNGLLVGSSPSTLASAIPYSFYLLASNVSGSAAGIFAGRIAAAYLGSALTADEVLALETALSAYLNAVGA